MNSRRAHPILSSSVATFLDGLILEYTGILKSNSEHGSSSGLGHAAHAILLRGSGLFAEPCGVYDWPVSSQDAENLHPLGNDEQSQEMNIPDFLDPATPTIFGK